MQAAILNGLAFNLSWLVIIKCQSNIVAAAVVLIHVLVHMRLFGKGRREWVLLASVFLLGLMLDQFLFLVGVLNLSGEPALAPFWLGCLWPILATTLMHAFASLQQRLWLAGVLGALGGGASYVAGTQLSEVGFGWPLLSPLLIATLWLVMLPALLILARTIQNTSWGELQ
jgi:hypothetical protein